MINDVPFLSKNILNTVLRKVSEAKRKLDMPLKLMGKKTGMTCFFDKKSRATACTVIAVEPNVVIQIKDKEKDGYQAVQLGNDKSVKKKNVKKPLLGHFEKAKVEPRRHLLESRTTEEYELGQEIGVEQFEVGELVDVCGISKGKGYQGVIKRHGFKGGPAAHGSGFHRHAGSTGMRSTPGRCLPGVKMPGQMGSERVTAENLQVLLIDQEKQIILVKGSIPGANNCKVVIRESVKKPLKNRLVRN